jgi:hypothetical protein
MSKPTGPITDQEMVEKYFEIKDYVEREGKAFAERMAPWMAKMELIENAFLQRLNARGAKNSKTDAGTAYKSTRLDCKVEDRNSFLKFCLEKWDAIGSDMLGVRATTEAVRSYIDSHPRKEPPPGVSVSSTTRVNIRRG